MKTAIVLGGRSGTSLTAGMLHILGVHMGDRLRAPDAAGPSGYFENLDFVNCTKRLITDATDGDVFAPKKIKDTTLGDLMMVRDTVWRNEREPMWGFKAPGSVYVLPIYELFVKNPHYIVCRRNPEEVARSLEKRHPDRELQNTTWLEAAQRFQDSIYKLTEGRKRLIVDFENLIEKPESVVDSLLSFLELDVTAQIRQGAIDLVRPDYRHEKV